MEENQAEQSSFSEFEKNQENVKKRPTFLTVLCILTFIGSGYGIIDGFVDYFSADTIGMAKGMIDEAMDDAMDEMDNEDLSEEQSEFIEGFFGNITANLTPENIRKMAIGSIVSCILTLIGGLLMWRLQKRGYYVYIIGMLIFILVPALVLQGFLGALAAGFSGFIGVLFVVLYGVNLKHMH